MSPWIEADPMRPSESGGSPGIVDFSIKTSRTQKLTLVLFDRQADSTS